jgi:hypothetical protein
VVGAAGRWRCKSSNSGVSTVATSAMAAATAGEAACSRMCFSRVPPPP